MATVKTGGLKARASFVPNTFNKEARTVDVCFGSDAPVLMGYWERYYEILSFDPAHVMLERLNAGGPVFDNHNSYRGTKGQHGVVVKAWTDGNRGYATIRFAKDEESQALMDKVEDGITRNISVGYEVYDYEEIDAAGTQSIGVATDNKIPTYRATKWEPAEVSFAPMPADWTVGVRSKDELEKIRSYDVNVVTNSNLTTHNTTHTTDMKNRFQRNADGGNGGGGGAESTATTTTTTTDTSGQNNNGGGTTTTTTDTTTANAGGESSAVAERKRSKEILEAVRTAKLPQTFAETLIERGSTVDEARQAIITEWAKGDTAQTHSGNRNVTLGQEQREKERQGMEDAIQHRVGNARELTPLGREFRGMNLLDMARHCIEATGESYRGMTPRETVERAFSARSGSAMSTSDFAVILGNSVNRSLRQEYEIQERTWLPFCRQENVRDFRSKTVAQLSEADDFKQVSELGEYKRTAFSDSGTSFKVDKFGMIIPISWESIINDDLNAFSRFPSKIAEAAARKQSDIVWGLILSNPVMQQDSVAMFHANHGNLTGSAAINIDNIGLARKLMRKQKGLAGKNFLNIHPKFMLVGPDNEQLAMQYTSNQYTPTTATTQNVWQGLLTPIVEPRITTADWYLAADPRRIDTIVYSFLEGEGELFTEQRHGFEVDGMEIKARMVFGAAVIDWKGFTYTPA